MRTTGAFLPRWGTTACAVSRFGYNVPSQSPPVTFHSQANNPRVAQPIQSGPSSRTDRSVVSQPRQDVARDNEDSVSIESFIPPFKSQVRHFYEDNVEQFTAADAPQQSYLKIYDFMYVKLKTPNALALHDESKNDNLDSVERTEEATKVAQIQDLIRTSKFPFVHVASAKRYSDNSEGFMLVNPNPQSKSYVFYNGSIIDYDSHFEDTRPTKFETIYYKRKTEDNNDGLFDTLIGKLDFEGNNLTSEEQRAFRNLALFALLGFQPAVDIVKRFDKDTIRANVLRLFISD